MLCDVACDADEEFEYCPDRALTAALHDWMEELNQPLLAGTNIIKNGDWCLLHIKKLLSYCLLITLSTS